MATRLETQHPVTATDLANALRALAMDAVQKANSGHPGMPMGMADIAQVLWNEFLIHNPADPHWPGRDRFVLSNGHGSMLIYGLLHLSGYALTIDDLKAFRQFGSKTPGHPEVGHTPGIETTTGPLGQGIANAVGMALAERLLAAEFNRDDEADCSPIDHYTYVFAGDGCLMEGVSHEACSLAGTLGLGRLIVFYDDNSISIDGDVHGWFRDDTPGRFEAYGWQVIRNVNGHDSGEIHQAIVTARAQQLRPTLICCKTIIGFGAPNRQGTAKAHGAALGDAEIALTRERLNWPYAPFEIPDAIYAAWNAVERGTAAQNAWNIKFQTYAEKFPELAAGLRRRLSGALPDDWPATIAAAIAAAGETDKPLATRKLSEQVLDRIAPHLPELLGGSADLTESNNTLWKGATTLGPDHLSGNYISYGVREFGMAAMMNGISLHGGFIPFGGTFLVFSDYARNAIRMAALMRIRSIFVLSHDSIGLGEDGPTHQPVEHIASLRMIPRLHVWRPADAVETAFSWRAAIERADGPTALVLSRQNLPPQPHAVGQIGPARGGYVLIEPEQAPVGVVIATGSEVMLAVEAAKRLAAEGQPLRVVSMPCLDLFLEQDAIWREQVLPAELSRRLVIEAGATAGWWQIAGSKGLVLGLDDFGHSAPAPQVFEAVGLGVEHVTRVLRDLLDSRP